MHQSLPQPALRGGRHEKDGCMHIVFVLYQLFAAGMTLWFLGNCFLIAHKHLRASKEWSLRRVLREFVIEAYEQLKASPLFLFLLGFIAGYWSQWLAYASFGVFTLIFVRSCWRDIGSSKEDSANITEPWEFFSLCAALGLGYFWHSVFYFLAPIILIGPRRSLNGMLYVLLEKRISIFLWAITNFGFFSSLIIWLNGNGWSCSRVVWYYFKLSTLVELAYLALIALYACCKHFAKKRFEATKKAIIQDVHDCIPRKVMNASQGIFVVADAHKLRYAECLHRIAVVRGERRPEERILVPHCRVYAFPDAWNKLAPEERSFVFPIAKMNEDLHGCYVSWDLTICVPFSTKHRDRRAKQLKFLASV